MISLNLRLAGCTALFLVVAVLVVPVAAADDWGRDRAAATAIVVADALDPAIRGALLARSTSLATSGELGTSVGSATTADGFAWGAAGVGAGVALAGVLLVAGCAMVLGQRHGRIRSA
jgi:hypothetical protein